MRCGCPLGVLGGGSPIGELKVWCRVSVAADIMRTRHLGIKNYCGTAQPDQSRDHRDYKDDD